MDKVRSNLRQNPNLSFNEVGHSIRETVEMITNMTHFKGKILWEAIPKRPFEVNIMVGDNSKAKKLLGWEPKYDLKQGLEKTIEFWRKKV
jgi:nucleoside-diphosphate-sugar epimerase